MDTINTDDLLFYITKEDIQQIALEKIGREITEFEIQIAKKGLDSGLLTGIDSVYNAIFYEMIEK